MEVSARTLSIADPHSPSPVTTRLLSYRDTRASSPSSLSSPPSSSCPSRRKPLLLAAAVAIYGACAVLWWAGGPATPTALTWLEPLARGSASLAGAVLDPRVLDPALEDPRAIHIPTYTCLGWRQTSGCDPDGPREPDKDRGCDQPVQGGTSGYCLLEDAASGQQVRAMRSSCMSVRAGVRFRCRQAVDIARMPSELRAAVATAKWDLAVERQEQSLLLRRGGPEHGSTAEAEAEPSRGIVMVAYPKLLVSVHAVVRLLREELNCSLPVELWYLRSEMARAGEAVEDTRPLLASLMRDYGPVVTREIEDARARGFNAKVHALLHSRFDQVLFLDADNVPVRDPSFLFTASAAFLATGAVFWPDFWLPDHTIFNVKPQSLLWEAVGTPFVDMFEQESGQLLVDRRRARASGALAALEYLAFHRPNHIGYLKLVYGDKDLFRLAWLATDSPFHMVAHPPASAGTLLTLPGADRPVFCGVSMAQFDPDAREDAGADAVLFLHRNAKKLSGAEVDRLDSAWTHVQVFTYPERLTAANATRAQRYAHEKQHYRVQIGGMSEVFQRVRSARCYGDRDLRSPHFALTPVEAVPALRGLERTLLRFAREAAAIGLQAAARPKTGGSRRQHQ